MKKENSKAIRDWTRKDFESLPFRNNWAEDLRCSSIVIMPSKKPSKVLSLLRKIWYGVVHKSFDYYSEGWLHDSGYRLLDFVAVDEKGSPVCRLSGCSDVIHLDGIGGYGRNWLQKYGHVPLLVPPSAWTMDCLPESGFLRLWPFGLGHQIVGKASVAGSSLSSFEFFAVEDPKMIQAKAEVLPPEVQ